MGLLQKLLSTLGLGESSTGQGRESRGETTVTVEHEPEAGNEAAVKGTGGVSEGTTASGSTGTITDTGDEQPGAAEPSEAAGESADDGDALDESGGEGGPAAEDAESPADAAGDDAGESPDVLNGIGPAYAERLADAGIETVADLAAADTDSLADETDLGEGRIANWIEQAKEY